ncbi:MAG: 2-dehydropantoate 2-reductase [Lysobacterales bacterium]
MRIAVLGAGSIGGFIGARLIHAGQQVVLIGRERLRAEVAAHGLTVSDADGEDFRLAPEQVRVSTAVADLAGCGLILVTVKSADTDAAAAAIAAHAEPQAIVVSLQNGLHNAELLRRRLPTQTVLAGMVPWNVVWTERGRFHRGTRGELMVEPIAPAAGIVCAALGAAGLAIRAPGNFHAAQWGKLLLNLNNPLNALSGLPLRQQLSQRAWRRILAVLMREALAVMRAAGIRPARAAALPPTWLPALLGLPDAIFLRLASSMLKLDPKARSSMADDLDRGRPTEIDYINGEVLRLAAAAGVAAPINTALVALVHQAERQPPASVRYSAAELARAIGAE